MTTTCAHGVGLRLALAFALVSASLGAAWGQIAGTRLTAPRGIQESTTSIMERQAVAPPPKPRPEHELQYPDRSKLPQNPKALPVSRYPEAGPEEKAVPPEELKIHTTSLSFNGATLTDTGAFPPDSMGTVGPTQFITFVKGRLRSFTKAGV